MHFIIGSPTQLPSVLERSSSEHKVPEDKQQAQRARLSWTSCAPGLERVVHAQHNERRTKETQAVYGTAFRSIMNLAKHRFVQSEGNEVMAGAGKTNYCQVSVRHVSAADRLPNYCYQCQFLAILYCSYTEQKVLMVIVL